MRGKPDHSIDRRSQAIEWSGDCNLLPLLDTPIFRPAAEPTFLMRLILASQSPRRRELLQSLGLQPVVSPGHIVESRADNESALDYVSRLAKEKCVEGIGRHPHDVVIGADTIGVLEQDTSQIVLEKPQDKEDYLRMMAQLSNRWHTVATAVAVGCDSRIYTKRVDTHVKVATLDASFVEDYWQSGIPQDKAGGYGIQSVFGSYIERIEGSYSAVVGLPLCQTRLLLSNFAISVGASSSQHTTSAAN